LVTASPCFAVTLAVARRLEADLREDWLAAIDWDAVVNWILVLEKGDG